MHVVPKFIISINIL